MNRFRSKPSWSKPANSTNEDLFHRSGQAYARFAQNIEEEQRKLKEELKKTHGQRHRERSAKRRRLSEGDDDDDDDGEESDLGAENGNKAASPPAQNKTDQFPNTSRGAELTVENLEILNSQPSKSRKPPSPQGSADLVRARTSLEKNYGQQLAARESKSWRREEVKALNDTDVKPNASLSGRNFSNGVSPDDIIEVPNPQPPEDDNDDASEEFPELARLAREKARKARLTREQRVGSMNLSPRGSQKTPGVPLKTEMPSKAGPSAVSKAPLPVPEPVLQILITSTIPNTNPLVVKRRLNQRLKDVRLAWIQKQGLNDRADEIFLMWKGKKLFDVTTCKSLGIGVDADGNVVTNGDILEQLEEHLQIEAVTQELFQAYREAKKTPADAQVRMSEPEVQVQEAPEHPLPEKQVRIILRARGYPEYKIIVKPVRIFTFSQPFLPLVAYPVKLVHNLLKNPLRISHTEQHRHREGREPAIRRGHTRASVAGPRDGDRGHGLSGCLREISS